LELWFDEKTGIKTSPRRDPLGFHLLWFDEKTGIKTSAPAGSAPAARCGLMKKRE